MPEPPHTPQASFSNVEPQTLSQPEGPGSKQPHPRLSALPPLHIPQSSKTASPLGTPAQSKQEEWSPSHTPHSSNSNVDPQTLSQPEGPACPHPQPRSTLPSQSHSPSGMPDPPQIPHSSMAEFPPKHVPQSSISLSAS